MQTGQPGFDQAYGMPMWRYLREGDPVAGAQVNAAMTEASAAVTPPIGRTVDFLTWILHDWNAACLHLLGNRRRAMTAHSRLPVLDVIADPSRSDELTYALDLQMLLALAGQQRTAAQCGELYDAAGLRLSRIIPTAWMFSLTEGIPQRNGGDRS